MTNFGPGPGPDPVAVALAAQRRDAIADILPAWLLIAGPSRWVAAPAGRGAAGVRLAKRR